MRSLACCSRRSPTRRVIRSRCSSSTCIWIRTSASIRSSGSRSFLPFRISCQLPAPPAPRKSVRFARFEKSCLSWARRPESHQKEMASRIEMPVPGSPEALPMAQALLESVAEKTGFPIEMLDLDMQLDVDLGIDSIKRVEIFSAVQDRLPNARAMGPEQVGSLRTLRQIAEFLSSPSEQRTEVAAAKPVVLRTLYPTPRPFDQLDRRDPVTLCSGGTIWITDDGSPLAQALERRLIERGYAAKVIGLDVARVPAPVERLCGLIVLAPKGPSDHGLIGKAFRMMRAAAPALLKNQRRKEGPLS